VDNLLLFDRIFEDLAPNSGFTTTWNTSLNKSIFSNSPKSAQRLFNFWCLMLLAVELTCSVTSLSASTLIDVPAGDSEGLLSAISEANQSSEVAIIRLNSGADYHFNLSDSAPEPISGHIIILGEGSHIVGSGNESYGQLFGVMDQAVLEIFDLVIRDFQSDEERGQGLIINSGSLIAHDLLIKNIRSRSSNLYTNAIFENNGQLDLNRVRIVNVIVDTSEPDTAVIIAVANRGDARLQNVLIVDGKGLNPELTSPFGAYIQNINFGKLELQYTSLILESEPSSVPSKVEAVIRNPVRPGQYFPGTTISSSIILGFECPFKQFDVSGGYNLVSAETCPFSQPTDRLGVSNQVIQFRSHSDGGLKVVLHAYSPAVDGVISAEFECPGRDAVGAIRPIDGNHDGINRCDIGAFEYSGGDPLFFGGENGLYFSASADGHYVTIQEVRPREYLIIWNTFDLDGNQAWVIAVGNRKGDLIKAQAEYQTEGRLIPGNGADVNTSKRTDWGVIEVQLVDCLNGIFSYQSVLPQFGSGSFNLDRLAYVSGMDCQDQ
jgi:hypothetical protein